MDANPLKNFLLGMKSLKESLFDDDLISREIKFKDLYKFDHFYFSGSNGGYYALDNLRISNLKKDFGRIPSTISKADCTTQFPTNDDKQTRNRLFIANVLLYLINEFDMSTRNDINFFKFYYDDKEVNETLRNVCGYLSKKLFVYRVGNRPVYINAYYDKNSKDITIMIGKYQTRGWNQSANFVFKKK